MSYSIAMRVLNAAHEPQYGNGQNNFVYDIDAVAQLIQTRLLLFEGEWWLNLNDGLPLFQSILGVGGAGKENGAIANLIVSRIEGTPFVNGTSNVTTTYLPTSRAFSFGCDVSTAFGTLKVIIGPGQVATISTTTQTTS